MTIKPETETDIDLVECYRRDMATNADTSQLSADETAQLVAIVRAGGPEGQEARERIIESLLPIAFTLARQFPTMRTEDVISIYNEALMEVIDHMVKTYPFDKPPQTLAGIAIFYGKRALIKARDDAKTVVRIPDHVQIERWHQRNGTKEFSAKTLSKLEGLHGTDRSMNEPVGGEEEGDGGIQTLEETLPAITPTPEEELAIEEGRAYLRSILHSVIQSTFNARFRDRNYTAICLIYGLETGEPLPAAEVARRMGLPVTVLENVQVSLSRELRKIDGLKDLLHLLIRPSRYGGKDRTIPAVNVVDRKSLRHQVTNATLSVEQVKEIRRLKKAGLTGLKVKEKMGLTVNVSTINSVAAGDSWGHIQDEGDKG